MNKPLGRKAYGHIPHLPNSRMGPGDHHVSPGQAKICTQKARKGDIIYIQEKLDGSCVSVAKINNEIVPLNRSGYPAISSTYEHHKLFAQWVFEHQDRFFLILKEKERICGEWLALAHGTKYNLKHEPFVVFDGFTAENSRMNYNQLMELQAKYGFVVPNLLHVGSEGLPVEQAYKLLNPEVHGAIDPIEGVVYRVEHKGEIDFLCKWVRPDKKDGCYLPKQTGKNPIWLWRPQ